MQMPLLLHPVLWGQGWGARVWAGRGRAGPGGHGELGVGAYLLPRMPVCCSFLHVPALPG